MATVIKGGNAGAAKVGSWAGTFGEALATVGASPRNRRWADKMDAHFCRYTANETIAHAEKGFPEAVESICKLQEVLFRNAERDSCIDYHPDVVGHFFDIGEVLTGVPEHWWSPDAERVQRDEIVIHVNGSMSAGVPMDRIVRRGAVLAEVVDSLLLAGPVRVVWHNRTDIYHLQIELSFERGSYSKNVLAFILAHPGMLRRVSFALADACTGYPWAKERGYGAPSSLREKTAGNVIVFDHHAEKDEMLNQYASDKSARTMAEKVLTMVRKAEDALLGVEV